MRQRWVIVGLAAAAAVAAVAVWLARGRSVESAAPPSLPLSNQAEDSELSPDGAWQRVIAPRGRGVLVIAVRDEAGNPIPARLTFRGIEGTRTPAFTRTDVGLERPGSVSAFDRVFMVGDTALLVPAGSYDVWFSHGPEWDAVVRKVRLAPTTMASLAITLHHVVDTPGWTSADFHVHASPSSDSRVPMRHRAMQFLADGVDVIVSTDHDVISSYAPVIAELGAGDRLTSLQGDEVTTKDWGHFGAFPLDNTSPAPATPGRAPASLFPEIRQHWPGALIDIHHPRLENGKIGYFHLGELDTHTLDAKRKGFSFDFDAIEVLNGYQDPDRRSVDAVLTDWFAFLKRGHRITGTGNSDTHHMTFNLGGFPRNYVQVDRPFDGAAIAAAVKAGRSYFTTGPVVDVTAGTAGLGDTVSSNKGPLTLHVRVRAPAWIDVARLTVLVDGVVAVKLPITGLAPVRFDEDIEVPVKEDGFIIVRVDGDKPMAPVIGDLKSFKVFPLAITNPIWVDFDGDGKITPPVR